MSEDLSKVSGKLPTKVKDLPIEKIIDLTKGTIQDLKNFDSKNIGKYRLSQNNLEKYPKGYIYINAEQNWEQSDRLIFQ